MIEPVAASRREVPIRPLPVLSCSRLCYRLRPRASTAAAPFTPDTSPQSAPGAGGREAGPEVGRRAEDAPGAGAAERQDLASAHAHPRQPRAGGLSGSRPPRSVFHELDRDVRSSARRSIVAVNLRPYLAGVESHERRSKGLREFRCPSCQACPAPLADLRCKL